LSDVYDDARPELLAVAMSGLFSAGFVPVPQKLRIAVAPVTAGLKIIHLLLTTGLSHKILGARVP
jgi:hypothetical protein